MKLKSAQVENFKCVENSEPFKIDQVTCLVGKNESGKSSLLEALYKLNPVHKEHAEFDALREYPRRRWSEYKERMKEDPDNVLTTEWELEGDDEKVLVEALGVNPLTSSTITIERGYDNETTFDFSLDERKLVDHHLRTSALHDEEKAKVNGATTVADLLKGLDGTPEPSERHQALVASLKKAFPKGDTDAAVTAIIEKRLPKILLFTSYHTMPGEMALTRLQERKNSKQLNWGDHVFLALLDLAGTTMDQISASGKFEALVAELEAVSARLSQEIFKYWTQNRHLAIEFRFDAARPQDPAPYNEGFIFRTRIKNNRHGVTVGFDARSSGFIWFFSFLVWFSQIKKIYGENLLILLDEPALNLHARAQVDLLRYINEKLKPFYQVVYTTHSPWMVDAENLLNSRTVEDVVTKEGDILGTKVRDDVLVVDPDTVFPLQGAIGYGISQNLFIGEHTLLVEGPSDLLYVKWFSNELRAKKRTALDPRWVICPVGGLDKVNSFVALFGANKLHIAVLTDYHTGEKKKVQSLMESRLLKAGHVFTANNFAGQTEADTEDIIGRANYVPLVNACYGVDASKALPTAKNEKTPVRVVEEVENHFRVLPPEAPLFDHFGPAAYLVENAGAVRAAMPELGLALDRFEALFKELNALLPKA